MAILKALAQSALLIMLIGGTVGLIMASVCWAERRQRGLEMFIAITLIITWLGFAMAFYLHG